MRRVRTEAAPKGADIMSARTTKAQKLAKYDEARRDRSSISIDDAIERINDWFVDEFFRANKKPVVMWLAEKWSSLSVIRKCVAARRRASEKEVR